MKTPFRVISGTAAKCLYAGFDDLRKLVKSGKSKKIRLKTARGDTVVRNMCAVVVDSYIEDDEGKKTFDSHFGSYLADCGTGTLYDLDTGKGLTTTQMWVDK